MPAEVDSGAPFAVALALVDCPFDEVADLQKMPKEVVITLKIYCESGTFARGGDERVVAARLHLPTEQQPYHGIAQALDTTDFHVEAINLLVNRVACEAGVALVVAIYSAIKRQPVLPTTLIMGDLSIQGNIKPLHSPAESLQIGMEHGARRALIPTPNKRNFMDVSTDIVERVDPIFYSDPHTAAMKALGRS